MSRVAKLVVLMLAMPALGQDVDAVDDVEWHHYGRDHAQSKYSPAALIDRGNVAKLEVAWRWTSIDDRVESPLPASGVRSTPLMADGRLFVITGYNQIVALDASFGEELWSFDPKTYERGRVPHGGYNHRGVEYWTDGEEDKRIIVGTSTLQLVALDAETGEPSSGFGDNGIVDIRAGLGREYQERDIGINSPPVVCGDTIVVGSIVSDFAATQEMPPGHVRGFDVRTGEQKWIFHTIPQAGELGVETWEDESWRRSGNTNVWSMMSCDDKHGYVYLPIGTPTDDHYGGHRLGDNLFAESLVCLDAKTGERVWHFQGVRHGVWDYDFPAAPNLVDIEVDGRRIEAVAQVSKQGYTYVFDRLTGEPVWPIEDRAVPSSKVPGERLATTQPFPTKPPPFERQGLVEEDLIDFTPELRRQALEIVEDFVIGPLFTPPIYAGQDGKKALIQLPGVAGGANWSGAGFDPESGLLFVASQTLLSTMALRQPDPSRSDLRYDRGSVDVVGPQGLPLFKPPYARITAIDLNDGEIEWQIPHGEGPRDHPAIEHLGLGPLGADRISGLSPGFPLVTKTLLFVAQSVSRPGVVSGSSFGIGRPSFGYLRAYAKATGELIWQIRMDVPIQGSPMTYVHDGRQYVAVAVGKRSDLGEIVAWALPN